MSKSGSVVPFLRRNLQLWNVTNFQVTDNPTCCARFTIPGLSHESFDIDANPKITSIMITSVLARAYALHKPDSETGSTFLDWPNVTSGKYTFVSSTEFKMSQDLYNPDLPKWPLDAKFSLGYVGNSSVANVIEFFESGNQSKPLWTNVTQLVAIDSTTRKPTALPEWFKDKYKGKGCMEKGFVLKPFDRPLVTFVNPIKVSWSDTDNYKHTNFASYVKFAIDALHSAISAEMDCKENSSKGVQLTADGNKEGQLPLSDKSNPNKDAYFSSDGLPRVALDEKKQNEKADNTESPKNSSVDNASASNKPLHGITKEKIANGLKCIQICYLSESLENQNLNVHLWQHPGQEYVVWCSVERDSKDICQIKLEYFDTPRFSIHGN